MPVKGKLVTGPVMRSRLIRRTRGPRRTLLPRAGPVLAGLTGVRDGSSSLHGGRSADSCMTQRSRARRCRTTGTSVSAPHCTGPPKAYHAVDIQIHS
jgi:hypothetical protein